MNSMLLWGLIPNETIPLLIVGGALLSMVIGRRVLGFLIPLLLSVLLVPFLETLVASLPWWLTLLMLLVLGLALLRGALALFLGERATGHLIGSLATDVVRWTLRMVVAIPVVIGRGVVRAVLSTRKAEVKR